MATYYRHQQRGLPLTGHTSETSAEQRLPEGYVFAFSCVEQVVASLSEWGLWDAETAEMVEFEGDDAYDPGDAEGYAVSPVRETRRLPFGVWLREHAEAVLDYGDETLLERYAAPAPEASGA